MEEVLHFGKKSGQLHSWQLIMHSVGVLERKSFLLWS